MFADDFSADVFSELTFEATQLIVKNKPTTLIVPETAENSNSTKQFTNLMPASLPQDSLAGDIIENLFQTIPTNFLDTVQVSTPELRFLEEAPKLTATPALQLSPEIETAEFGSPPPAVNAVDMQDLTPKDAQIITLSEEQCTQLLLSAAGDTPIQNLDIVCSTADQEAMKYEPPSPSVSESNSTISSVSGRYASGSGPIRNKSKRRILEKDSDEYKMRRERNNIAVRKSRNKAKQRQELIDNRNSTLENDNKCLRTKVEGLQKELELLKGLYENAGLELPSNFSRVSSM